ncbi:hypothetical protein GLOIN_2v1768376 [Rhizophagus clarus]|uniref:Crinkler effector protein N-terminal domain-containing protein n=1 Tax=Rhizophagus clarus TaxID=94130 RepID=A0A8H3KZ49_9GLOM|nr:hypothetical protein GLOIN_2v1768376 [Rhizophagus clarus]
MIKSPVNVFFVSILAGTVEGPLELDLGGQLKSLEYFYRKFEEYLEKCERDPYYVKIENVMISVECTIESKYQLSLNSKWLKEPLAKAILNIPVDKYNMIKIGENKMSYQELSSKGIVNLYPATETNENKNMNEIEENFRCYTKLDCLKNEDIKNKKYMNFVFLNAPRASWDVFSFLNYESSETGTFCVVQQIKYTNIETLETMILDQDSFNDEYEKVSKAIKDVPINN